MSTGSLCPRCGNASISPDYDADSRFDICLDCGFLAGIEYYNLQAIERDFGGPVWEGERICPVAVSELAQEVLSNRLFPWYSFDSIVHQAFFGY